MSERVPDEFQEENQIQETSLHAVSAVILDSEANDNGTEQNLNRDDNITY